MGMSGPMDANEALTLARLRQWICERTAMRNGKTAHYRDTGRPGKRASTNRWDAAYVRVIDFEKALSELSFQDQIMLIMCCAEGYKQHDAAAALKVSLRTIGYQLPIARRKLTEILDRRNLL